MKAIRACGLHSVLRRPHCQKPPSHLALISTVVSCLIKEAENRTGSWKLNYLLVPRSDPAELRLRQLDRSVQWKLVPPLPML